MPRVNLVAHGVQVELDASEISVDELSARAYEMLVKAVELSKPAPVGFPRPAPDKGWIDA